MALDGVFLGEIKKELMPLIGGRVDKIHQPSKGELLIALRTYDGLKKHNRNIYQKLGAKNRAEAERKAMQLGLIHRKG